MDESLFHRIWNGAILVVKHQSSPFVFAKSDYDTRPLIVRIPMERGLLILVDLNAVPGEALVHRCNEPSASEVQLGELFVVLAGHKPILDVVSFCETKREPKHAVLSGLHDLAA